MGLFNGYVDTHSPKKGFRGFKAPIMHSWSAPVLFFFFFFNGSQSETRDQWAAICMGGLQVAKEINHSGLKISGWKEEGSKEMV